jgi:hypothetical protein
LRDNILERCSDILVDFKARHNLSRAAFVVFVVIILIGLPEIIEVHARLPNNTATVVSPLDAFKENSALKNASRLIGNNVQVGSKTLNLSNTTDAFNPRMCVVAKNVYIIWEDRGAGLSIILFKRSIDNGATFGPAIRLSNSIDYSTHPEISASGNVLYVIWERYKDSDILLRKSTDNGTTFGPVIKVTDIAGNPQALQLATSGDNLYVLWKEAGSGAILLKKSTNGGAGFGPVTILSTSTLPDTNIATVGTNVYVVWDDIISGNYSILFKRSIDNGATFGPAVDLSKYYEGLVNFNGIMDLQLVTSHENNNVYLGWNQPILSPVDNSSSLHSDVVVARVQPHVFVQSSFYYNEQLVVPERRTSARGPGEQLLSLVRPQPQAEEGVWFYADYWKGPLTNLIVDDLVKRKINTIYFSAPNNGGWDNSSKVFNYVDFINYARARVCAF